LKIFVAIAALFLAAFATQADEDHIRWTKNGGPSETYITGGPWTLEQSGPAVGLKSAGYCSTNGIQIGNPGTQRMQPYYFPFLTGHEKYLQGYFDWRPLSPQPGLPLKGFPAMNDGPTDATTALPEIAFHTTGLLNPDGILGIVPRSSPRATTGRSDAWACIPRLLQSARVATISS